MALAGSKGSSQAQTQSSSTTVTTTTNNIDNRIFTSDMGAIEAGTDLARSALQANVTALSDAGALISDSVSDALNVVDRGSTRLADLATDALSFGGSQTSGALDFGRDVFGYAGELVSHAFENAFDLAGGVLKEGQVQLGNTVSNLNAIARQQSTSDNERVQDIATKGLYVAGALAVLITIAVIWRGS